MVINSGGSSAVGGTAGAVSGSDGKKDIRESKNSTCNNNLYMRESVKTSKIL